MDDEVPRRAEARAVEGQRLDAARAGREDRRVGLSVEQPEGPEEDGGVQPEGLLGLRSEGAVLLEEDLQVAPVLDDEVGMAVAVQVLRLDVVGPRPGLEEDGVVGGSCRARNAARARIMCASC